jgi:preprotein translocase subunit SecG
MELNPYQPPVESAAALGAQDEPGTRNLRGLKTLLRVLIVGEIVFVVLSIVVGFLTESTLPDLLRDHLKYEREAGFTQRDAILAAGTVVLLALFLVCSLALFLCWRPARLLYLVTTILGLLLAPIYGPYVQTGWEVPLEDSAIVCAGVILGLIYFSPLKILFEKRQVEAWQSSPD